MVFGFIEWRDLAQMIQAWPLILNLTEFPLTGELGLFHSLVLQTTFFFWGGGGIVPSATRERFDPRTF